MSWIDIYISVVGFLMGLAVCETVASQFLNENISPMASRSLDFLARWSFPLVYLVFMVFMSFLNNMETLKLVVHFLVGSFVLAIGLFCCYEGYFFPDLLIRRTIKVSKHGAYRHSTYKLGDKESQIVFDNLCKRDSLAPAGAVHVQTLTNWILRVKPVLKRYESESRRLIEAAFGDHEIYFPAFKREFSEVITKLTLLLHDDPLLRKELDAPPSAQSPAPTSPVPSPMDVKYVDEDDEDREETLLAPSPMARPCQPMQLTNYRAPTQVQGQMSPHSMLITISANTWEV